MKLFQNKKIPVLPTLAAVLGIAAYRKQAKEIKRLQKELRFEALNSIERNKLEPFIAQLQKEQGYRIIKHQILPGGGRRWILRRK